nr:hypothetical protein [Bradyrhizobium cosmicum]QDP27020.1 hypothetical protein FNV92_34920 [Bradyrhizobium cosmicum]
MKTWPAKDPDEILDYDLDWTMRLYSADELALVAPDLGPCSELVPQPAASELELYAAVRNAGRQQLELYLDAHQGVAGGRRRGRKLPGAEPHHHGRGRTMDQTVKLKVKSK